MHTLFGRFKTLSIAGFILLSCIFAFFSSQIIISSDFKKLLPLEHPYLVNMMEHKDDLTLGNDVRIIVKAKNGYTIFNNEYLQWVKTLTDKVYEIEGLDKVFIKTIWTPNARWIAVTEQGFEGGEIIPPTYDGSVDSLKRVQQNLERSTEIGRLVADDYQSSTLYLPLTWRADGESIDYKALNNALEELRAESQSKGYDIAIIGVAKKIGDLINGAQQMGLFFLIAVAFIFVALFWYTSSFSVALILTVSGILGVIWQLGLVSLLGRYWGFGLDPYSMLVPFLVFAISISHGLQLFNASSSIDLHHQRARSVFQQLGKPASLALASDAIGFATLAIIPIAAIQDLAITASLGVLCLFFTTLLFVPLCISIFGVSDKFIQKNNNKVKTLPWWARLSLFGTQRVGRFVFIIVFICLSVWGFSKSYDLQVGDLRAGAPELRSDSQYNKDIQYYVDHFSQSVDVYVALVRSDADQCNSPANLNLLEDLQWRFEQLESVQNTFSLANGVKAVQRGLSEGYPKWSHVPQEQIAINGTTGSLPPGFINLDCSFTPLYVFLKDHKAATLAEVTQILTEFDTELQSKETSMRVLPAAGNAGIEAAVNESIEQQQNTMLWVIYAVVFFMCLITFKNVWHVLAILMPLAMTSILCQVLMVWLGIGVKVSTLPVIALGVGIGVDYGVYIVARYVITKDMSIVLSNTGRIVAFTGIALAVSVGTWMFSAIQFQADMGYLLTFMFIWNMVGALFVIPCLLSFFNKKNNESS